MNKKVSIIVPVYNTETFLRKCLDSLVNQTLEDIEILVVNDGSPDHSQKIIDDYVKRYPNKMRTFIKENGGLSDARNFAVPYATGEYIGFVDSDDFVDLDMYEQMYMKASETNADVVCCPVTYEYHNRSQKCHFPESEHFGVSAVEMPSLLLRANSFAWNKIYNAEKNAMMAALRTEGYYFDEDKLYVTERFHKAASQFGSVQYKKIMDRSSILTSVFRRPSPIYYPFGPKGCRFLYSNIPQKRRLTKNQTALLM